MRAVLIDPAKRTVSELTLLANTPFQSRGKRSKILLTEMYGLLDCTMVDAVHFNGTNHDVWVDDEGLFVNEQKFFMLSDFPNPLPGRGIVLGHDASGNTIDCALSLEDVQRRTHWVEGFFISGGRTYYQTVSAWRLPA